MITPVKIGFLFFVALISAPVIAGKNMSTPQASEIVEKFYDYFNHSELDKLYALIDDNMVHQINYDLPKKGKQAFIDYIQTSNEHYQEHVDNYILMLSEDGRHGATKIQVTGKYIKTDASQIPAKGQNYHLEAINVFEIKNGKIINAKCWFDEIDLNRQLKG